MTGLLFIFYTIQSFGPVVFTIIMTIRIMLSFMLWCIIYNHPLSAQAVFGLIVVFVALFLRVYARYHAKLSYSSIHLHFLPSNPMILKVDCL